MTTTIEHTADQVLRLALRGNGSFSLLSGLILAAAARPVSVLLGVEPPAILLILGIVLIIYGIDLFWVASRPEIDTRLATAAVVLDVLWVLGSAALLLTGLVSLTAAGVWAVIIVADIVALFAIWQGYGLWRMRQH